MANTPNDERRLHRFEKELQFLVSEYLLRQVQHEVPGLVTVARVEVTGDLRSARVHVSIMQGTDESFPLLERHLPELQRYVSRKWRSKFTPKLSLSLDHSFENAFRIQQLLKEVGGNNP